MNNFNNKILIIEDSPEYELLIKSALGNNQNYVYSRSIAEAKDQILSDSFDLIILDLILTDGDGYEILMSLKQPNGLLSTPIIITSGKSEVSDKVMGLNYGAIDYIVKPFNQMEIRARIENKLNLINQLKNNGGIKTKGNLQIDANSLKTSIDQVSVDLSPLEFKLLKFFMDSFDQVFSREQLLQRVWGENTYVLDRTVDSTIASLRKKTKEWDHCIKSIYGVGYKLNKKFVKNSKAS